MGDNLIICAEKRETDMNETFWNETIGALTDGWRIFLTGWKTQMQTPIKNETREASTTKRGCAVLCQDKSRGGCAGEV
jgi:hypothetical protein